MWVPGSLAYLVPLFVIGIRLLFGASETSRRRPNSPRVPNPGRGTLPGRLALPIVGQPRPRVEPAAFDLLRVPLLGRFLRWRHARLSLQVPLLLLAGLIVYDGFRGPPVGAMNLAGVLPWIHWRGLVILGLLAAGNVFCMACPFMVPRTLARRWLPQGRSWPRRLRNKWLAVALARGLPVGLRGVRSLGQPMVDRLDRPGLLRGRLRRSTVSSAAHPSASMSVRSASSTSCSRWSRRWRSRCATRSSVPRAGPRTASAGGRTFPDVSSTCSSRGSRATWTARSASTVSTPVLTTTSASLPTRPGKSCGTIPFARASAGSASAPTWRLSSWC